MPVAFAKSKRTPGGVSQEGGVSMAKALDPKKAQAIAEFERYKGLVHVHSLAQRLGVSPNTIYTWLKRWKAKRTPGGVSQVIEAVPELTWEKIIELVPDVMTLGEIVLEGLVGRISRISKEKAQLAEQLNETKEELAKVTELYNSIRANRRIGTLTLDSAKHRLIPKS